MTTPKPASAPPADALHDRLVTIHNLLAENPAALVEDVIGAEELRWLAEAASAQVREVEPKYFDDVLHPDDPRRSPCVAADDTPSKSRAKRIALEKGEPVAVAQGLAVDAALTTYRAGWEAYRGRLFGGLNTDDYLAHQRGLAAVIADHARIVAELEAQLSRKTRECELKSHAIDRWIPCPDHRDKTERGACLVCAKEKAEASLAACRALVPKWRHRAEGYDAPESVRIQVCADELETAARSQP